MNSPNSTMLSTSWKIAKLHGVLMIVASFLGFLSLDKTEAQFLYNISAFAYVFLFITGVSCFFIQRKRVIATSIIALFFTIYAVSFWVTNEYYLPIGSFIIYLDLIMITTIFFGKRVGLFSVVVIMALLLFWLFLLDIDVINPVVTIPDAESNAIFNCFLFGYFFMVAAFFKENITRQFNKIITSERKKVAANDAHISRVTSLRGKIGQVYEIHGTHIVAIKLYIEKFNFSRSNDYQLMKDELNKFLLFIDNEITKINTVLSIDKDDYLHIKKRDDPVNLHLPNKSYKIFYQITIFFSIWIILLHYNNLSWFNIFITTNILSCIYIYVKEVNNKFIYTVITNFNVSMLFISFFLFTDSYNGAPILFAISIYLALSTVYVFGLKKTAIMLIIFSITPYLRILSIENGWIDPPIEITIVGFDLFLHLFPIMIFTYLLTANYLDDVDDHFNTLQESHKKLSEISALDKKEEEKLRAIISGISDLSNYNSHQVRAPIARLSGILNLYLSFNNDIVDFERTTGYNLPSLIQKSLSEFEIAFNEFDYRIKSYKDLAKEED